MVASTAVITASWPIMPRGAVLGGVLHLVVVGAVDVEV